MPAMTSRERVLAAIRHQPVDRFPTDIWAVNEVWEKLFRHFNTRDAFVLYEKLGIDAILDIKPGYHGPLIVGPDPSLRYDEWGFGHRLQEINGGVYEEQVYFPLENAETIADLEKFPWPSPDDYDYSGLRAKAARHPQYAVLCGYWAIFYWHNKLRGLENSLMDTLARPDFTHYLVERVGEFFAGYHRRCFEATRGLVHLTQVTDDFGSQNGLLISPKVFDTFYRASMQRAIDLAHSFDLLVFHHNDGDNRRLLPRLAEMGIDLLNPIQWRCGNWDLPALKAQFGGQICFHGGIDNQETLPFGAPADVRAEVRRIKAELGSDGTGLIIAPCHNLQAITPVENIIALYEAAAE
jgi:uroporphyrinogen decarboxylase